MPSAARSQLLPEPWVFFLDRSLGSRPVAEALRTEGETVEVHDAHFAKDASDVEWLGAVGHTGWVVVSKDDRIRLNEVEGMALTEAGVAAFFLGRSDLTGPQMARAIVTALPALRRALRRFDVPFTARISLDGDVSVFESAGKRFSPAKRIRTVIGALSTPREPMADVVTFPASAVLRAAAPADRGYRGIMGRDSPSRVIQPVWRERHGIAGAEGRGRGVDKGLVAAVLEADPDLVAYSLRGA